MNLNDKGIEAAFARFVDGDQHDNAAHFVAAIVTAYLEASQPSEDLWTTKAPTERSLEDDELVCGEGAFRVTLFVRPG